MYFCIMSHKNCNKIFLNFSSTLFFVSNLTHRTVSKLVVPTNNITGNLSKNILPVENQFKQKVSTAKSKRQINEYFCNSHLKLFKQPLL